MTDVPAIPEPLQDFSSLADVLRASLIELDALREEYRSAVLQGKLLANVVEAIRIESTYNSIAIEGSTLTLRQTQLVLEGTAPPGNASMRELYEARNHDLALRMIERWAVDPVLRANISEDQILRIHERVMADVAPGNAGHFRDGRVLISGTGYVPPASRKFDVLIPALLRLARRAGIHPVLAAAELHYNFVAVHPFNDGNGRTARLLMDYFLLRHGFPHVLIAVSERAEYLLALDEAYRGRVEHFARFMVHSIRQSLRRYLG